MAPAAMRPLPQSLSDAQPVSYWLDDPGKPGAQPALTGDEQLRPARRRRRLQRTVDRAASPRSATPAGTSY